MKGVLCPEKGKISFEECANCAKCLSAPTIRGLKPYNFVFKRNVYHVNDVVGCLREAYCNRKLLQPDVFHPLERWLAFKRGKLFEKIGNSTGWQELGGSKQYTIDGEIVKLTGNLDSYDPERCEITEKKSKEIKHYTNLPTPKHILQLQCYGTIFKDIIPVKKLRLEYFDMNRFRSYDVSLVDKTAWLEERVNKLHVAVRDSTPPEDEPRFECRYCLWQKECKQRQSIIQINPRRGAKVC